MSRTISVISCLLFFCAAGCATYQAPFITGVNGYAVTVRQTWNGYADPQRLAAQETVMRNVSRQGCPTDRPVPHPTTQASYDAASHASAGQLFGVVSPGEAALHSLVQTSWKDILYVCRQH